jgi:hypothetical protein
VALLACTALARLPIFNDATIDAHRARQQEVNEASQAILARAEGETRDLTEAEQREVGQLADEFDSLENQIGVRTRVLNQAACWASRAAAAPTRIRSPTPTRRRW